MAREYETVADIVAAAARNQLDSTRFGGPTAGRAYVDHGSELAAALAELSVVMRLWSVAAADIAATLRASAVRYGDAAARSAEQIAAHG